MWWPQGKKGNPAQALRDLELIAAEAESRGLKEVWLEAHRRGLGSAWRPSRSWI